MENKVQEQCSCIKNDTTTCTSTNAQYAADVGIPIKLKPYAVVGNVETECSGNPIISLRGGQGTNCCCGCEITVIQTISIRIPITYGTVADVGEATVNCKKPPNC